MADSTYSEEDLIELAFLRDLETDQLIAEGLLDKDMQMSSPLDDELVLKHKELSLHITADVHYPVSTISYQVENYAVPREDVIQLRSRLKEIVEAAEATNNLTKWKEREAEDSSGIYEPTMVVLELARETNKCLTELRSRNIADRLDPSSTLLAASSSQVLKPKLPFQMKETNSEFSTGTQGMAFELLGKTIQQLVCMIRPEFRVLHVEEVLRHDLATAFYKRTEHLRRKLLEEPITTLKHYVPPQLHHTNRKEDLVEFLLKPCVSFHGTQRENVPSIVRHGFVKPGHRAPGSHEIEVQCGSAYGMGIYSSPDPNFSLDYADPNCRATSPEKFFGVKLFICATTLGRSRRVSRCDDWQSLGSAYPGTDSHVANKGREFAVFHPAQIIPVYAVHLDWGHDNAKHFRNNPQDPEQWIAPAPQSKLNQEVLSPADIERAKRAKKALRAQAAKQLPYGFGPATGNRFIVEEVGAVDEDDEEYGDYQALRGEPVQPEFGGNTKTDFWSWVGAAEEEDTEAGKEGVPEDNELE